MLILSQTCYVAKDNLDLFILLPLSPICWNHKCMPPCLAYALLGIKSGLHAHWASTLPDEPQPQTKR